jgi:hypothetical protein
MHRFCERRRLRAAGLRPDAVGLRETAPSGREAVDRKRCGG